MGDALILGMTTSDFVHKVIILAVAVVAAIVVSHVIARVLRRVLDASNVPSASIFVNLARALVWVFALLCVMQPVFNQPPTAFVTALGVTSLVVSFGMQDTVSNVVSGLGLMMGKVVQPGDVVRVSGFSGVVTDVNWRSTIVRDRVGNVQVIPNSVLNKTALERLSSGAATLCEVNLVVAHGADLARVEADILASAREVLGEVLARDQAQTVCFSGSDSYGIACVVYLHVIDGASLVATRDALMRRLAQASWLARAA